MTPRLAAQPVTLPEMIDPALTALVGATLGALIAGASTWLNSWAHSKRERGREGRAVRREAYTEYLHQVQRLVTAGQRIAEELYASAKANKGVPALSAARLVELRAEADAAFDEFARATQTVRLVAPDAVIRAANDVTDRLRLFIGAVARGMDDSRSLDKNREGWDDTFEQIRQCGSQATNMEELNPLMRKDISP
jgi:hypothetical protein